MILSICHFVKLCICVISHHFCIPISGDLLPYNILVWFSMFWLVILWSIPVAAIQTLANLETIFEAFDITSPFDSTTLSLLQGYISVLILDLWLMIIPEIVEFLTKVQRKTHRGRLEMLTMTKYFDCLIFMVMLVTVITGTIVSGASDFEDILTNLANELSSLLDDLADGLSNMSVYFMLYVLLNAFIWLPLELFRPSHYLKKWFKRPEPNRYDDG